MVSPFFFFSFVCCLSLVLVHVCDGEEDEQFLEYTTNDQSAVCTYNQLERCKTMCTTCIMYTKVVWQHVKIFCVVICIIPACTHTHTLQSQLSSVYKIYLQLFVQTLNLNLYHKMSTHLFFIFSSLYSNVYLILFRVSMCLWGETKKYRER